MWNDELTPQEMDVVTSVFRQYETGLREGVIDAKVRIKTLEIFFLNAKVDAY